MWKCEPHLDHPLVLVASNCFATREQPIEAREADDFASDWGRKANDWGKNMVWRTPEF